MYNEQSAGLNDNDKQIEGLEMRLVDVPTDEVGQGGHAKGREGAQEAGARLQPRNLAPRIASWPLLGST